MNIESIQNLADIMISHGLTALEFRDGDASIRMEKSTPTNPPMPVAYDLPPTPNTTATARSTEDEKLNFSNLFEVKSPLVGVFYAAPSPGADSFVTIGSNVSKGDTLCIIEAMKLMNEITAERDGEIVDICIRDGDIAEYGQTLFKISEQ